MQATIPDALLQFGLNYLLGGMIFWATSSGFATEPVNESMVTAKKEKNELDVS